ncbi:hypothetical protein ACCS66_35460, partial [Rhizobium ruizarguesonis]
FSKRAVMHTSMTAHQNAAMDFAPRTLLRPISDAGSALARLDERIARSPVGAGWIERSHFADAMDDRSRRDAKAALGVNAEKEVVNMPSGSCPSSCEFSSASGLTE